MRLTKDDDELRKDEISSRNEITYQGGVKSTNFKK